MTFCQMNIENDSVGGFHPFLKYNLVNKKCKWISFEGIYF